MDKKPPAPPPPLEPAADEFQEPTLTSYHDPRKHNPDITPIEMLPPAPTHEKSALGRALADVEVRDLEIVHLKRQVITLELDRAALKERLAETIMIEVSYEVEVKSLKEKLAEALDERAVMAARLENVLAGR